MFDNGFPSPTAGNSGASSEPCGLSAEITPPVAHRREQSSRYGLPILSTEKLSAAEDALLGELARTFRLAVARLEEARQSGTVARGLEAANLGERLGQLAGQCAATLGSRR